MSERQQGYRMAYEHLGLIRWPFPVVPAADFCTFIADRKQLRSDLKALLATLSRQDASSIHLLWSWFGAGKTHTLYFISNEASQTAQSLGGRLHPVYGEFPKSPRSFVDVYRSFAHGLDIEDVVDAYLEISTSPEADRLHKSLMSASLDLVTALQVLATGSQLDHLTAIRWLRGEGLPIAQYRQIGISQKIGSSEDASRILAALVNLFALAAESQNRPSCRVVWLLDEFQRIEMASKVAREDINTGLHSTFNACPTGLTIFLSFSGKPTSQLPDWFSDELRDRIGRTKVIILPPLKKDEAVDFVRDVLANLRTPEAYDFPEFFPFSEDACRFVIDEVAETEELKPRAIMHAFNAVLQEAEQPIQSGRLTEVTTQVAKRALAERVSLTSTEEEG